MALFFYIGFMRPVKSFLNLLFILYCNYLCNHNLAILWPTIRQSYYSQHFSLHVIHLAISKCCFTKFWVWFLSSICRNRWNDVKKWALESYNFFPLLYSAVLLCRVRMAGAANENRSIHTKQNNNEDWYLYKSSRWSRAANGSARRCGDECRAGGKLPWLVSRCRS